MTSSSDSKESAPDSAESSPGGDKPSDSAVDRGTPEPSEAKEAKPAKDGSAAKPKDGKTKGRSTKKTLTYGLTAGDEGEADPGERANPTEKQKKASDTLPGGTVATPKGGAARLPIRPSQAPPPPPKEAHKASANKPSVAPPPPSRGARKPSVSKPSVPPPPPKRQPPARPKPPAPKDRSSRRPPPKRPPAAKRAPAEKEGKADQPSAELAPPSRPPQRAPLPARDQLPSEPPAVALAPAPLPEEAATVPFERPDAPSFTEPATKVRELRPIIEACEAELALKPDSVRAADLHFEIGRAQPTEKLALKHFKLALERKSDHLPSIRAARALHLKNNDIKAAVALFDAEIGITTGTTEKAELCYAKGAALMDLADDAEGARACFAEAVRLDANNPTLLKAFHLAELVAKDWANVGSALEHEGNAVGSDTRHRAALLTTRARLLERRQRKPEVAVEQYEMALTLDPQTPSAMQELKRLLFAQARWGDLVATLEREAELTDDPINQALCWWTVARIQGERLGARAEAIAALEHAAELNPTDALLLEELARLYEASHDRAGLADALGRLAKVATRAADRLGVLRRLAELYDGPDGDLDAAMRWYEAALALSPGDTPSLRALDSLYTRLEKWGALADMCLAEAAAPVASAQRAAAHSRAADIFESRLGQPEEAARHYASALALDPSHEGAFKALVRLHTSAGRHRELIELYDRAVDSAPSDDIAIAYLFKIGALYEDTLRDVPAAIETYERVLERKPNHLGAIHALQRAAEIACHYRDLVMYLEKEAKLAQGRAQTIALQHRAAEVLLERTDEQELAIDRLQGIIEREPKHVPTLVSLGRVLRKLERHDELLRVYELELEVTSDGSAKVALLVKMAELCEQELGQPERATALYRQALQLDPVHPLARAALARLLRQAGNHTELAKALESELLAMSEPLATARAAMLLGEVYEVHLNQPEQAATAYQRALNAAPSYPLAVDALARIHGRQGAWKDLAETLTAAAEDTSELSVALDNRHRAAALYADRLGKPDVAIELLEAVADGDPDNLAALLALEPLYVVQRETEQLIELYSNQADAVEHGGARAAALVARARLIEQEGVDEAVLRAALTAVLLLQPDHPWALSSLERLAHRSGDDALLVEVDKRVTETASDPRVRELHFTRLGDLVREQQPTDALQAYRAALRQHGASLAAIRGLAQVGTQLEDAATLVEAFRREADWTRDPQISAELLVSSATWRTTRLGDLAGAIDDCDRALAAFPDHEDAAQQLTLLLRQTGDVDRLIEELTQAAHAAKKPARQVQLWQDVGTLYANDKQDLGAAITAVKRALDIDPNKTGTILQLAELHGHDAQWKEAASLLARVVAMDDGDIRAHLALARIHTKHLRDADKAVASLERVLKAQPENQDALCMMLRVHVDAGARGKARKTADRLMETAGDNEDMKAWALLEVGRLELSAGGHKQAAEALHEAVCLVGLEGEAAKVYRRMLGDDEPWERYAKALRTYLRSPRRRETAQLASAYLELARILYDRLGRTSDAFQTLQDGLVRCSDDPSLILEKAEMLLKSGRQSEAAEAYRNLVASDPLQGQAWRGLTRVLQQQGLQGEAAVAAAPLVVLDEATDVERNLATERALRPGTARPGAFATPTLRAMSAGDGGDDERVANVLAALGDGLAKVYPAPFDLYGVRKGDRIKPRSGHPLRQDVDRLAAVFGVERFEMYVHAGMGGDIAVELTQPPSMMVPAHLAEMPEPQRVFLLARALASVASGLYPAIKLSTDDLALVMASAVRRLEPDFEEGQHDSARLAAMAQQLAPSWLSRGKVDEAVQSYYAEPTDIVAWAKTVACTVTRAAAILTGDLAGSVAAMQKVGAIDSRRSGAELMRSSPVASDLLRYWMSDPAAEIRRLAGIL